MAVVTTAMVAGIGTVASVAGGLYNRRQQKKAARAQKRASRVQRAQRGAEQAIARRGQIAEARRKRAQILNIAGAGGTTATSGFVGATGSIQSQLGTNLGFMEQSMLRAGQFERFQRKAEEAQVRGATGLAIGQGIQQISGMFMGGAGGAAGAAGAAGGARPSIFTQFDTGNTMRDPRTGFSGIGL